jgi:hypothetical protein
VLPTASTSPSLSASNHADSGTATVHDCDVPFATPAAQKKFVGHRLLVPTLVPAGQKKPYGHCIIDGGVVATLSHTNPAVHGWHAVEPPAPYWPAGHAEPAADTAPLSQPKPGAAVQLLQFVEPDDENRPGEHRPLHVDTVIALPAPNEPAAQALHVTSPARLYVPTPHTLDGGADVTEPGGQAYPAAHSDVQADLSATALLNRPALQLVHSDEPPSEYCPAPHATPVDAFDTAAHAKPGSAVQLRHVAAPASEYSPGVHGTAVGLLEAGDGHA